MAGCNWYGTTEVELAENKPYCPDCASNCKRECTVCHKPYSNLKFYKKHSKRCNSCQSHYIVAKTKKLPWKIIAGNLVIQPGNKNNMTVMKNLPLLEKKKRRRRMNMKLKTMIMIALIEESLKEKICSNEASSKTKNVQKASTPTSKRQWTVMETLQINKMK